MTKLLGIKAFAERLSISHWTVRKKIKSGEVRAIRIGRRVLLSEEELERFVAGLAPTRQEAPDASVAGNRAEADDAQG